MSSIENPGFRFWGVRKPLPPPLWGPKIVFSRPPRFFDFLSIPPGSGGNHSHSYAFGGQSFHCSSGPGVRITLVHEMSSIENPGFRIWGVRTPPRGPKPGLGTHASETKKRVHKRFPLRDIAKSYCIVLSPISSCVWCESFPPAGGLISPTVGYLNECEGNSRCQYSQGPQTLSQENPRI